MPTAPDTLAEVQAVTSFVLYQDGQPSPPGRWALEFEAGIVHQPGVAPPLGTLLTLQYSGESTHFARNMLLQVIIPARFGRGSAQIGRPFMNWQQRWVADTARMLTLATALALELPTPGQPSDTQFLITTIAAKQVGPGNLLWNGFTGVSRRPQLTLWGIIVGYNYWPHESLSLVVNYDFIGDPKGPPQHILQAGIIRILTSRVSIGPGVLVGLSRNKDTPRLGAGARLFAVL